MLHLIIPTEWIIPQRFAAYTIGFVILIRPSYKNDLPLIEHEKVHVTQFWRTLGLNGIFYLFSKSKRLQYELEAYRKQLEFEKNPEKSKETFALYLSLNYNLDITKEEAKKLLD